MAGDSETVYLVPHTHWDREWYEPFQRFRMRLVDLLDDVLTRAETDPEFRFTLDGQTAAVDDHLEVRPEDTDRVAALVRSGQLAVGPWQILMDEFLCTGETIVRNLENGSRRAAKLGASMPVGYLPDMFGHCAQMPQILRLAGLSHACVWRGVPSTVDFHSFQWEAPDGSAVRCEYLPSGYGNAAYLLADDTAIEQRATDLVRRARPWFGADPVLAMYGTDHSAPLPTLMSAVRSLQGGSGSVRLRVSTLADYFAVLDPDDESLPRWRGELRSHARANILPGVISARVHLKRDMGRAERMVERYAEPLAALWSRQWPGRFLDMAWDRLIASSCHDSVTGCGVDDTAIQVAARIAEAEQLGQAIRDGVAADLATGVPADAIVIVNPSPAERAGLVPMTVLVPDEIADVIIELADGTRVPTQEIARSIPELYRGEFAAEDLREAIIRRSFGQELFNRRIQHWSHEGRSITFHVGRVGEPTFDIDSAVDEIEALAMAIGGRWTLAIVAESARTVLAEVTAPALGWTTARATDQPPTSAGDPVTVSSSTVDNGLVSITVRRDGCLRITAHDGTVLDGVGRIVDVGDAGDTYNYGPPARDAVVEAPHTVRMQLAERGPLLGALIVDRTYDWPIGVTADRGARSTQVRPTTVSMRVELRTGEPFVRLALQFDNQSLDHRVRVHLPLARSASVSHAEGQFSVTERGLSSEGGYGEEPIPTFPAGAFVDAGGAAVLLEHATEYELVDGARELALTLLRSVGQLSRSVHPYREEPAGPEIPTPLAQCLGSTVTHLAVLPHGGSFSAAGVLEAAERFRHDLHAVPGRAAAGTPLTEAAGLTISGKGVVMSSLRRREDWLELRLVAQQGEPTIAMVEGVRTARRADLFGSAGVGLTLNDDRLELALRPWEIATVQLQLDQRPAPLNP
ncbi:MAG: hypothetical protein ACR2JG_01840 [Geodermatophilaceae bacterium]